MDLMAYYNQIKVVIGFPGGSDGKESACNAGDPGLIPRLGRSPGKGNEWLPPPVFSPREFHELGSLAGYSPWTRKESDMTEQVPLSLFTFTSWPK